MSNGKTHTKITIVTGIAVFISLFKILGLLNCSVFTGAYIFSGCMFSGDLDINSVQSKRWGLFKPIWLPYRRMFNHRSVWTHSAIAGTLIRFAYVFCVGTYIWFMLSLISFLLSTFVQMNVSNEIKNTLTGVQKICLNINGILVIIKKIIYSIIKKYPNGIKIIIAGCIAGSLSHDITDVLYSTKKKIKKKIFAK